MLTAVLSQHHGRFQSHAKLQRQATAHSLPLLSLQVEAHVVLLVPTFRGRHLEQMTSLVFGAHFYVLNNSLKKDTQMSFIFHGPTIFQSR